MTITKKYQLFDLIIKSDMGLPELNEVGVFTHGKMDEIHIKVTDLSNLWAQVADFERRYIVKDNFVMFQVTNTAIFCIENGKNILVSPMIGVDENKIRLYILGSCMGILLMQRMFLPLHGSVINVNGKAYAFIGDSGAGKSTIASAFISKGYDLLTDDLIAVSFSENNEVIVKPSYPQQKLWQNSIDHFGMEVSKYTPLFERENKYAIPVTNNFYHKPLILSGVFELISDHGIKQVEIHPLNKLESLRTLYKHTYRNFLIQRLGLVDWHFQTSIKLSNQVIMYQLKRPATEFTANELVRVVLDTIDREVGVY
ncbi:aldolase [Metabacillus elymi]|uniref:Aldolase n=1 Tax=Metabacillus elymi TaxID=2745198 RepID=A0ABX6S019_9BACI|nr:aldolase [Metabacillus sp. KUDC1714]QNF26180.1 aldolase [Metabacillus sp. KUDC1714]